MDGQSTDLWLELLRRRLSPSAYDSVVPLIRPTLPAEQAWADAIAARSTRWPSELPRLAGLFPGLAVRPVRIVLGNRGGEDAFSHDSLTIGFDLAALVRVYGPAIRIENAERLDRLFRHEVIHTFQKRWLAQHPFVSRTPIEAALLDIWLEGPGNYFSLSSRWRPASDGTPATLPQRTLAVLAPRFVARMRALACADSLTARPLLADLSAGPFEQKWGALPAALWLLDEQSVDSLALQRLVMEGPPGIWRLARQHLPPPLADSLAEAREQAASCF